MVCHPSGRITALDDSRICFNNCKYVFLRLHGSPGSTCPGGVALVQILMATSPVPTHAMTVLLNLGIEFMHPKSRGADYHKELM